ncbi:MAG TPA: M28 family peptidase [Puia sp.]|uniref:M28 family peptidase n=1 Tax=Puia sp. TaxID=2045100 RepID=UPI002CCE1DB0|nr:M28 family peptidase [Puia sp.]HVU94505.1 M28 family peptidase [Puia sp.]
MYLLPSIIRQLLLATALVLSLTSVTAQNALPKISDVRVTNNPADNSVIVKYKITDPDDKAFTVHFLVSADASDDYTIDTRQATGSIGDNIPAGKQQLTWNYKAAGIDPAKSRFKLVVSDGHVPTAMDLLQLIDSNSLKTELQSIIATAPKIPTDTTINRAARIRDLIRAECSPAGYQLRTQDFVFGDYKGANIIAVKPGTSLPNELTAVSACIDLAEGKPCANSNGSGLAGMLQIAAVLSHLQLKRTVHILGFDYSGEEFIGSNQYVFQGGIKDYERITGLIDLDRIGSYSADIRSHRVEDAAVQLFPAVYKEVLADSSRADFLTVVSNQRSHPLAASFMKNAGAYFPHFKVYEKEYPEYGEITVGETDFVQFSDHIPFWYRKYPAVWITDAGATARINGGAEDTPDKINFSFFTQTVRLCLLNVLEMGQPDHAAVYEAGFTQ